MKTLMTFSLLFISFLSWCQWTGPDAANKIYYTKGFVGIGTTTPTTRFHLKTVDASPLLLAETNESQISYSLSSLDLRAKATATKSPLITWYAPNGLSQGTLGSRTDAFGLTLSNGNNFVIQGGNVAIGVTDPKGYQLAVGGKFIAEEVVVKLNSAWPDYVFNDAYTLRPLKDLYSYIKKNRHLPEIPTADEVAERGIDVNDITCDLLKKVEELTLYLIQANQHAEELQTRIEILEAKLSNNSKE